MVRAQPEWRDAGAPHVLGVRGPLTRGHLLACNFSVSLGGNDGCKLQHFSGIIQRLSEIIDFIGRCIDLIKVYIKPW